MKPKDLKTPFAQEKKQVLLNEKQRILFIPDRVQKKNLLGLKPSLLGQYSKVHIEYCSGNGQWIHQKALQYPDILWIAVEKKFYRVQKIWSKMQNSNLSNYFIICGDALVATEQYLFKNSLDAAYINFPDPWPKNKHAKFRLMQRPFIQSLAHVLKEKAVIHFLTDSFKYSEQTILNFLKEDGLFDPMIEAPHFNAEIDDYGNSYFRSLWEEKKRGFYFSKFQKKCKYKLVD